MAITIVATAGSATANSLASEQEYIDYAATLTNVPTGTTVSGATCTETEKKALVMSFRAFNALRWKSRRTTATQSGCWPQSYAENPDAPGLFLYPSWTDLYFADTVVPDRVKNGQIEMALAIIEAGATDIFAADPNQGVIRKKTDVLETAWTPYARPEGMALFPKVMVWISPMLASSAGSLDVARQ